MLTKGDLQAIKTIVKDEVRDIRTDLVALRSDMDKNTKDLTDLILAGFSTHEPMLSNHEKRITNLEKVTFKSN